MGNATPGIWRAAQQALLKKRSRSKRLVCSCAWRVARVECVCYFRARAISTRDELIWTNLPREGLAWAVLATTSLPPQIPFCGILFP